MVQTTGRDWRSITPDVLVEILVCNLGADAQIALSLTHVCKPWRDIILGDRYVLEKLKFKTLRVSSLLSQAADEHMPAVLKNSLAHANPTAHVARAKFLISSGRSSLAAKHWRTAAKKAHPLALYHVGLNKYETFDPEDAYLHLKRACKQLMTGSDEDDFLMTQEERQQTLREASLILGIIICDNDLEFEDFGFEKDYSGAITWLKVARDRGCGDAAKILNSLFRNGNY